jgi:hypothetical protein
MVEIVLVGFLPIDHGCSCDVHPYGCGKEESEGHGVGRLVSLHLVEQTHLVCYSVKDDSMDGCHLCFAA